MTQKEGKSVCVCVGERVRERESERSRCVKKGDRGRKRERKGEMESERDIEK